MRLFAALPLNPAAQQHLLHLRLRLNSPKDGLRWSEPEQWHITLLFFGDVSGECMQKLAAGLDEVQAEAPVVVLSGCRMFPNKGILYAEVEATPSLLALHTQVLDLAHRLGMKTESRPFHPHVTLARSKGKAGHLSLRRFDTPELLSSGAPVRWISPECLLLESTLGSQGAVYSTKAARKLRISEMEGGPSS